MGGRIGTGEGGGEGRTDRTDRGGGAGGADLARADRVAGEGRADLARADRVAGEGRADPGGGKDRPLVAAVVRDLHGRVASLGDGRLMEFWAKGSGGWEMVRTKDLAPLGSMAPDALRKALEAVAGEVSGAALLVAREFRGLAFQILIRSGPALCEMPDFFPRGLDEVLSAASAPDPEQGDPARPVESPPGSGMFRLDLSAALAARPDLTSKKILRPFLDRAAFLELRVLFDHLPPWLEAELGARGLRAGTGRRQGGGVELFITPERTACT